jgi:hypothetical protein
MPLLQPQQTPGFHVALPVPDGERAAGADGEESRERATFVMVLDLVEWYVSVGNDAKAARNAIACFRLGEFGAKAKDLAGEAGGAIVVVHLRPSM